MKQKKNFQIAAKEPNITDELARYEGQVGWTEQEKKKLVQLINASTCLDWEVISVGMNRRSNECKMQYDALNGNKAAQQQMMIEEVDDDVEASGPSVEDISEVSSTPTTSGSSRRSGLARNAKKTLVSI